MSPRHIVEKVRVQRGDSSQDEERRRCSTGHREKMVSSKSRHVPQGAEMRCFTGRREKMVPRVQRHDGHQGVLPIVRRV